MHKFCLAIPEVSRVPDETVDAIGSERAKTRISQLSLPRRSVHPGVFLEVARTRRRFVRALFNLERRGADTHLESVCFNQMFQTRQPGFRTTIDGPPSGAIS